MTAIITDRIRDVFTRHFLNELTGTRIGDSDNHYSIAVARSQQYQHELNTDIAPDPDNSLREERLFRYNMQSVKLVQDFSFVIPMYEWAANTAYNAYNDNQEGQPATSYYVRTSANNVYLCVRTGKNATGTTQVSTVQPDHTDTSLTAETDGYVWKFLYTITTANSNAFLTSEFMPVKFVDSARPTDPEFPQLSVQNASIPKQIVGYRVTLAGGPYTSAPAITIKGNGTGAKARSILSSSGGIAAIEIGDSASAPLISSMGTNYDYATVSISTSTLAGGGTAAKAVPIFSPTNGLGADPRDDLRSTSIMLNVKPTGQEDTSWIIGNDYRQLGVFRNLLLYDSSGKFVEDKASSTGSGLALKRMTLTTLPGVNAISYSEDIEITGGTSGAKAWLDMYDDSNTLYYHQDEYTGFDSFENGETVTVDGYTASTLTIDSALITPRIDQWSGQLLYIDNRATAVTRDAAQTEDIKIVIEL